MSLLSTILFMFNWINTTCLMRSFPFNEWLAQKYARISFCSFTSFFFAFLWYQDFTFICYQNKSTKFEHTYNIRQTIDWLTETLSFTRWFWQRRKVTKPKHAKQSIKKETNNRRKKTCTHLTYCWRQIK